MRPGGHVKPSVTLRELEADSMGPEHISLRKLKRDVRRELVHLVLRDGRGRKDHVVSVLNRGTGAVVRLR